MDMKEEMMNDAVDDVIGDEEDDEERCISSYKFFYSNCFCNLIKILLIVNCLLLCKNSFK